MISLIFCGDLKYCPYLSRYTERLEKQKISYRVLFWNRGNFELKMPFNYVYYDSPSAENLDKIKKLKDFMGFRKWILQQLKKYPSDGLILLSTLTGVLIFDKLKKYSKKYIFDIRDYSYENLEIFRKIEKKIIERSAFTAISSKGFKSFLPEHDYVIAHNFNRNEMIDTPVFIKRNIPIKLVWNGTVRFFDFQKKYIDALKNDSRFIMIYHGTGTDLEIYKSYCKDNNINNVVFTGVYENKDKYKLLADADILNNSYGGRDGDQLRYAISNRFYDGVIYHIPQLVEPDGYKAAVTQENGIGIALEASDSFADELYAYYNKIEPTQFDKACKFVLKRILEEDNIYIKEIDRFIHRYNC